MARRSPSIYFPLTLSAFGSLLFGLMRRGSIEVIDAFLGLSETALIGVLISFLVEFDTGVDLAAVGFQTILYILFVYTLSPKIFRRYFGDAAYNLGFRLIVVFGAMLVLSGLAVIPPLVFFIFLIISIIHAFYLSILQSTSEQDIFENDGFMTNHPLVVTDSSDVEGKVIETESGSMLEHLTRGIAILLASGAVSLVAMLIGTLIFVFGFFFPVLEVSVLIIVISHYTMGIEMNNFEEDILNVLQVTLLMPAKGISAVLIIFIGLLFSSFYMFYFITYVSQISISGSISSGILTQWLILISLGPIPGLYGLWYWWRQTRRMNTFLQYYSGEEVGTDIIVRPIALTWPLLPSSVALFSCLLFIPNFTVRFGSDSLISGVADIASVALAVLSSIYIIIVYLQTHREDDPQPIESENIIFTKSYMICGLSAGILLTIPQKIGLPFVLDDFLGLKHILLFFLPVSLFYYDDFKNKTRRFFDEPTTSVFLFAFIILVHALLVEILWNLGFTGVLFTPLFLLLLFLYLTVEIDPDFIE
ncbi:hypothetical protein [Halorubrum kocurii]|uniref:hypothetical protein n=1 Tax=Halorubrum kocurii TaxID=478441 RepID=UPI000A451A8A|nr:hypothetical protein [Halorubrum kocurii]